MELTDILRCPKTGSRLRFVAGDLIVHAENADLTYPVVDGIVDFCGEERDRINKSYDAMAPRYDRYITSSSLFLKVCNTIVWGPDYDNTYLGTVLSYLPEQFDGVLLDVPVGTAIFTSSVYARFPNATIIGVDSSMGMLRKARERFEQRGLRNVCLVRADVAALPVRNGVADIVLSMNGWHAFADKRRATAEMRRVLRKDGKLVACGYVKGARRTADWFVSRFGVRNGYFTPPFFDVHDMAQQFAGFTITRQGNVKSVAYFEAINEGKEN